MGDEGGLKMMAVSAIAVTTLAIVALMGIAVLTQFKNTGLVDNTAADNFVSGLAIFATFMGVIVIALVGKIIIGLFKKA